MNELFLITSTALVAGSLLAAQPGQAESLSAKPSSVDFSRQIQPIFEQLETRQHWAFKPPQRSDAPKVKNEKWIRNPIDAFVLARLEKEDIKPSPETDRRTLIRRLSLDLIGLPPAPAEAEAFVQDKSADAYDKLVEHLLASPHFGERWGRHWLDRARYADSDGYEKDSIRPYAYLYRDWVIRAINRDLPFDQFTIEQLAGDLLPDATHDQKVATGFHRQTLTNKEGGVDQEEFRCKAVVDRVSTTGSVWLGMTVGCAECHSHKYDPITQREFYQLFAFFNNADEKDVPAPQPAELARYNKEKRRWEEENNRLKEALSAYVNDELPVKQAKWEQSFNLPETRWTILEPRKVSSANGATLTVQSDKSIQASDANPATDAYTIEATTDLQKITGFRLEILGDPAPGKGPGRSKNGNFVLSEFTVKVRPASSGSSQIEAGETPVLLQDASADHAPKDWPVERAIDGNPKTGWAIDPQFELRHVAVFGTKEDLELASDQKLIIRLDQFYGNEHTIGCLRLSATSSGRPFSADLTPDTVIEILATSPNRRGERQNEELAKYYRDQIDPEAKKLNQKIQAHARKEPKFPETKAAILAENEQPRKTHLHIRGDFLRKGEAVQPGTLAVLHPLRPPTEAIEGAHAARVSGESARPAQPDRLDLARWLFDPDNPLTSRVSVNWIWFHLFGRGLVATLDDFGARGEKPSHPELLDWLATEFPKLRWSQKAMIKLMVTSSTYRQASRSRPELIDRDPINLLLARQNRFRLEAENVRDVFLAASGLLNPAIGGPSVRPPLPADIAAVGYANQIKWKDSEGADRYRRGLYVFFQRTVPYPMLLTFDAPDSNVTCPRRERSNTPIQALTLLNDPVFFECAQALGRRFASESGLDPNEKIRRTFELCLGREPTKEEFARLQRLYADQLRVLQKNPENATKIVGAPMGDAQNTAETAALVAVARTLLNVDELVTRE